MRFARGDVRDLIVSPKTTMDLRTGAKEPCSGRNVYRSTFARFSGSLDFRLSQQYLPRAEVALLWAAALATRHRECHE